MDNLIFVLFISIFVPVLLMAILVEPKARLPITFVLIGLFISVFASEINAYVNTLLPYTIYEMTTIATPITEEILKALPILFYALFISDKREKLFTASMATGIGFAILENAFFLLKNASSFNILDAIMRAFGAGLMHGMCTLLVGVGISFVKKKRKIFEVGTFALLSLAITYHAVYNMLVQSRLVIFGILLPITTYIPFLIWRLSKKSKKQGEVQHEKLNLW